MKSHSIESEPRQLDSALLQRGSISTEYHFSIADIFVSIFNSRQHQIICDVLQINFSIYYPCIISFGWLTVSFLFMLVPKEQIFTNPIFKQVKEK
uniref:Uncharacterized protein n=1 Tax=Anguilla anguilla TaxID=7936 RepID=A0A0E9WG08_ANGAN